MWTKINQGESLHPAVAVAAITTMTFHSYKINPALPTPRILLKLVLDRYLRYSTFLINNLFN